MVIKRDKYLDELTSQIDKDMIKVITGVRRSGKSFLLFTLFYDYLKSIGIKDSQIIRIDLDEDKNEHLRDVQALSAEIKGRIKSDSKKYFVLLDELQYTISKEELKDRSKPLKIYGLLNSLMHMQNVDPNLHTIEKFRYSFKYGKEVFNLDVFDDYYAILENETCNSIDNLVLPDYLKIKDSDVNLNNKEIAKCKKRIIH